MQRTSSPKLLIVERDRDTRTLLELAFTYYGDCYAVSSAPSDSSALLQFGVVRPDLVILDVGLGEAQGWETLRRLRELTAVPIIALSSIDSPAIMIRCLERGANYFMRLPVSIQELRCRVAALLQPEPVVDQSAWSAQFPRI